MPDLSYPIGKFVAEPNLDENKRKELIDSLDKTPVRLLPAVADLSRKQLETPYRPGGWTVLQTVNHIADSHMNGFIRFKLALTEDFPTIKPYQEKRWAQLEDGHNANPEISLSLLVALHQRWTILLRSLEPEEFARQLNHPEMGVMSLNEMLQLYEWHGRHHVAHITTLRRRMEW
ncbi:MAG TPA: putative metal-dependent hydrolase [Blastocatellia bacterium]|nr:putative metal-dependent hydrolase [Blastocatellia bacterium]